MTAKIKPRINTEGRTPLQDVIPLSTPFILFVDPSSACNFKCKFCPTGDLQLIKQTGRFVGTLDWKLYKKIIDDLQEFDEPLKVLRLYKDGEPLLNKKFPQMIEYAKRSNRVPYVDTTTNAALLTRQLSTDILNAGLDKINISINGMQKETYSQFCRAKVDIDSIIENIMFFYEHRGNCEVVIKAPKELLSEEDQEQFLSLFGEISDRINIENTAPCWPNFDVEARTNFKIVQEGIYGQPLSDVDTCPYIFYSMSINSDGTASACFLDWDRSLVIGDVRTHTVKDIWNSKEMDNLRILHLSGDRSNNSTCKNCYQLRYGMPDNIDPFRDKIIERLL